MGGMGMVSTILTDHGYVLAVFDPFDLETEKP
jgi:hypothetical protein